MSENAGRRTFYAGEALATNRRVKLESGTTTTPPEVVYADAGEQHIGVTEFAAADGDPVTVRLITAPGTVEISAADSFAIGATLYGADDGQISDTSSGSALGIAVEAATAQNDLVEVTPFAVLSTTAGTVSVADTGGFTTAATAEAALAEIYQHLLSAQATIPIPLGALTYEDGTAFTKQTGTTPGFAQISNAEQVLDIPVDAAAETFAFSIPVPQDLDDSADVLIHALVGKSADLDALTLDCEVYPVAAGDTGNADIQDTAAQAITQAASELVYTCGADGVLAAPGALNAIFTLGGTNDGDAVYIYGVWVEYTRAILTA
jgi:hypothetical protein